MKIRRKNLNLISLAMMLAMLAMIFTGLPKTNADIIVRDSHLYINVAPNPVGLNQAAQILCWANIYPSEYAPNIAGKTGPAMYARFHNFTFTITKPDGTAETKVFPETDPLGSAYFNYIPNQLGTYYVQCTFPGETYSNNASFSPQTSKKIAFVVQTAQVQPWVETPLPTDYWTRPIDASNRNWWSIAGNWLDFSQGQNYGYNYWTNFAPYTTAPNTAHIVWKQVLFQGGVVGGENYVDQYYMGESYSMKFMPIVLDGRLYYNLRVGQGTARGFACVDIRTGEELYRNNDTTLTGGFVYNLESPNQHGTIPYLVQISGSTMNFFDPLNGQKVFAIVNCTSGAIIMNNTAGPGYTNDMNSYILSNNQLVCWSFSKCVGITGASGNQSWANGIQYNVTIPKPANSGSYAIGTGGGLVDGNILVGRSANTTIWPPVLYLVGVRCTDGQIMWTSNTTLLENPAAGGWRGGGGVALSSDGGVYLNYKQETMQVVGWDLATGAVKYTTVPRNDSDWGMFTSGWSIDSAYGKFYVGAYDGFIYAYDIKTGQQLWKYSSGNSGLETPYGSWPFFLGIPYGMTIADSKVFAATGEHSPNDPYYRGEQLHVIDVNTGQKVWSLQGWWLGNAIADGYYVGLNGYDGRIYSIGKGLSSSTVSASPKVTAKGSTVLIEGTVLDMSPSQPGTPCVSPESMTPWMEYLNMQQPQPTNVTGVPVTLEAIAADGTVTPIGTVMSDLNGYRTTWTPPSEGVYTILASFLGSDAYGSSHASTALAVGPTVSTINIPSASDVASQVISQLPTPVPATPAPTIPSASDVANQVVSQLPGVSNTDMAIIVVVVIGLLIGLVNLVLMLRKK